MSTRCLITGGAGFIGSHLAERLVSDGNEVWVVDDLSTGRKENIRHLEKDKRFSFFRDTIFNYRKMKRLIARCDVIYHLAASVGVSYIIANPIKSIQINVRGTEIVLELASSYKKKVFLASSSEIYGKNDKEVLKEDDVRILGSTKIHRWSYSCTKALDEFLALAHYRQRHLPVIIARFFNICGPRQIPTFGMVIPRFVREALANQPITVYGDGKQVRSFTYITDVIDGIVDLVNHQEAIGEVFNIGSYESITILELAQRIKGLANSESEIVYIPYEEVYSEGFEDMRYRVPDINKISKLIGYSPKIKLNQMLELIVKHHRGNLM